MEQAIFNRMKEAYENQNHAIIWASVSNPANTISRAAIAKLDASAPSVRATIKEWRAWIVATFPEFEAAQQAKLAKQAAESEQYAKECQRISDEHAAKDTRKAWQHDGRRYPHALAFVQALKEQGYKPHKKPFGVVEMRIDNQPQFLRMKRAEINAAIRLTFEE